MGLAPPFGLRGRRMAECLKAKHPNIFGLTSSITISSSELTLFRRRGRDWLLNIACLERIGAVLGVRVNGCKVASVRNGLGSAG